MRSSRDPRRLHDVRAPATQLSGTGWAECSHATASPTATSPSLSTETYTPPPHRWSIAARSPGSCSSMRSHGRVSPLTRSRHGPTLSTLPRLFSRSTPETRRFARRSIGSTCWPIASEIDSHRSRETTVTCRVRLRLASSTMPSPERSATRCCASIGPRRHRLRQILSRTGFMTDSVTSRTSRSRSYPP